MIIRFLSLHTCLRLFVLKDFCSIQAQNMIVFTLLQFPIVVRISHPISYILVPFHDKHIRPCTKFYKKCLLCQLSKTFQKHMNMHIFAMFFYSSSGCSKSSSNSFAVTRPSPSLSASLMRSFTFCSTKGVSVVNKNSTLQQ